MKPERLIAEQLGLERELLLAYAPFPEFQARTLKMLDCVRAEDRVRLDPVGAVLVGDDPTTSERVAAHLNENPEAQPIVGLGRAEVDQLRSQTDIRQLFFGRLFTRDLFSLESPLRTDTTFFGRSDLVATLVDRFRSGQNSALFGLRRIGKTSVLFAIRRRCDEEKLGGVAYLDVSNPRIYLKRWWEILQEIAVALAEPLNLTRGRRSKVRALNVSYAETDAAGHFSADIKTLGFLSQERRLLVMLDEIENMTFDLSPAAHQTQDALPFWQTMRSIHQESEGRFCFILAGVNPYILERDRIGVHDNPLFSTVQPFYLQPLGVSELREMVRRLGRYMAVRFDEAVYERFHNDLGGHPFLVRKACSQLLGSISTRPAHIDAKAYEDARRQITVNLERTVRQILNVLATWYPDEYELLRDLAAGNVENFKDFAVAHASFTQHVEGYGLVQNAQTSPRITIQLVADHLRKASKLTTSPLGNKDPDDLLAEISRRRNRIERKLRITLQEGLRFARGRKAAHYVLESLSESRRAVLSHLDYANLWDDLYLLELRNVLQREWAAFQTFFSEDSSKVLGWLDHINKIRADAHARSVSEEDLSYLRVCFKRMEELLDIG